MILHPATLLKLFMISTISLVVFLGLLKRSINLSANRDSLTSFPTCILLFPSLALWFHVVLWTLYWKGMNHSWLQWYHFKLSPFGMKLTVDCSQNAFVVLRYVPCSPMFSRTDIVKVLRILLKFFLCVSVEMIKENL